MSYESLVEACYRRLEQKQAAFNLEFDISGADQWYYQQAVALLKLSWGDNYRYFRYAEAGTFSEKTGTWLWAWDNGHILEPAKSLSREVRKFGAGNGYELLTEPHFESTEIGAWELFAVALDILDGIGVYRIKSEHLHSFLVIMEEIAADDGDELMETIVECEAHKAQRRAFVCTHIVENTQPGFEEAFATAPGMWLEPGDDLSAWCNSCESVRAADDGWTDENMKQAAIRIVCETCYFNFKERELGYR